MAMNIKSEEAHSLATELAALLGTTMTEAVTRALREAVEKLKRSKRDEELYALVKDMQRRAKGTTGISIDALYDKETGLPK